MMHRYSSKHDQPATVDIKEVQCIEFLEPLPIEFRITRGDEDVIPWRKGDIGLVSLLRPRSQEGQLLRPYHGHATSGEPGPLQIHTKGFFTYVFFVWERQ